MRINKQFEILSPEGFVDFYGVKKTLKKTCKITFTNESTLEGSNNHIIYDHNDKEIKLKDITIGQKINSDKGILIVKDKITHDKKVPVYDVINSGKSHLYYTNGFISHNCDFLGSGDDVISHEVRDNIAKTMIRAPKEKYMSGTLWQWKDQIVGHRYIMGVDVSRGDSEDFSSINIIDFDEREQVLEYIGKIPPDSLAEIAYRWGILYNCFIGIDITGGMGIATARKLQEMNYKDLYIDGINVKDMWSYNAKAMEKIPGISFNNKRTQIVASFEEQLRNGFIIRSERLLAELNTFVYLNGRPDHMKGAHDDAIMSMAIALYIGDVSFNQLKRVENQNKAMIESWTVNERTYEPNKSFYSYGTTLDPVGFMQVDPTTNLYNNGMINPMNNSKEAYKEYSWLFTKKR